MNKETGCIAEQMNFIVEDGSKLITISKINANPIREVKKFKEELKTFEERWLSLYAKKYSAIQSILKYFCLDY